MEREVDDLERRYKAAMAAAENAGTKDEKTAYLEEAVRIAQTMEWLRNAAPAY